MRIARINQVSRASAFGVRARRMVAGLTAFATRSTLATLVVGAVGLFGAAPAAAQCWPSCGPVWWEDIPMGQRLTYYFPASRRGYFTGQMSVRYGTCCGGTASTQFPWGRWFSRPTSNCVSTTQQFSVTVSATQTSFDAGCPAVPACPDGCSCTANLGNPTNRRTFAWTWHGEPRPYDFIAGIVPAGPGETAARFVVTNKGECTTQTSISGVYSLDGGRTKQPLQLIAPAGGTQELLLPIPAGDACAQTCTLWYTVIEFLPNGQQPSVSFRPMTIPLVQSPECRRFRDAFAVEEPFDFVAEAGATAVIERRLPGPEWTGRWEFSSDSYAPNTPLADGPRPGGSVLSGTSTPRLEISGCTSADVGIYFLRVTPPGGTPADEFVESSALLRVDTQYPSCPPLPSFTREPADATLPEGGSLVTLDYALGGPPTNYGFDVLVQWYVDGVPVDDGPHTTASGVSMQIGDANTFGIGEKTLSLNSIAFPKGMADRSFRVQCEIVRTGPDYQCTWGTFIRSFERTVSVRSCAADLDGSGTVDASDLSTLLSNWGEAAGDVDGDGDTDASDLSVMLSSWGECAG